MRCRTGWPLRVGIRDARKLENTVTLYVTGGTKKIVDTSLYEMQKKGRVHEAQSKGLSAGDGFPCSSSCAAGLAGLHEISLRSGSNPCLLFMCTSADETTRQISGGSKSCSRQQKHHCVGQYDIFVALKPFWTSLRANHTRPFHGPFGKGGNSYIGGRY